MKPTPAWAASWVAASATLLLLAACASVAIELPAHPVPAGPGITVEASPVSLDPADAVRTAKAGFRYAGGIAITSAATSRLHGVSDVIVSPDGRLTAITDAGDLLTARLALDNQSRLSGWTRATLRPLLGEDGQPLPDSDHWDAEGLTAVGDGQMLVSFEQTHRIWRYPTQGDRHPVTVNRPQEPMADNDGMEGLAAAPTVAPDAYWVGVEPGDIWICRLSVPCREVEGMPRPATGFRLSSLTSGPHGELVILHHSYIPAIGSRITVTVIADPLGARKVIGAFSIAPSPVTDNFEGIAVVERPGGDWRLYLLSDDNFRSTQRTLMLAFDWTPPR